MKKNYLLTAFFCLIAVFTFVNCGGDSSDSEEGPQISVQVQDIEIEAAGSTRTINVTSNTNWTASTSVGWIEIRQGNGSQNSSFTIIVLQNTESERTAWIHVQVNRGTASQDIKVTQKGAITPSLTVDPKSLSFTATGGENSFTITSNTSWTVSSDQSWCTVSPTSGSNDGTVTIKADENKSTTSRSANITVKYGDKSEPVTVSQAAADVQLSVAPISLSFTENGGSEDITITCNSDWTVSSNQTWCTVSPASGSSNGKVTVTAIANDSNGERSATITVKSGNVTQEISVTQAAKPEEGIGRNDYDDDVNLDKNK